MKSTNNWEEEGRRVGWMSSKLRKMCILAVQCCLDLRRPLAVTMQKGSDVRNARTLAEGRCNSKEGVWPEGQHSWHETCAVLKMKESVIRKRNYKLWKRGEGYATGSKACRKEGSRRVRKMCVKGRYQGCSMWSRVTCCNTDRFHVANLHSLATPALVSSL